MDVKNNLFYRLQCASFSKYKCIRKRSLTLDSLFQSTSWGCADHVCGLNSEMLSMHKTTTDLNRYDLIPIVVYNYRPK